MVPVQLRPMTVTARTRPIMAGTSRPRERGHTTAGGGCTRVAPSVLASSRPPSACQCWQLGLGFSSAEEGTKHAAVLLPCRLTTYVPKPHTFPNHIPSLSDNHILSLFVNHILSLSVNHIFYLSVNHVLSLSVNHVLSLSVNHIFSLITYFPIQ